MFSGSAFPTSHIRSDAKEVDRGIPQMPVKSAVPPSQSRLNERFARVLRQKKGPDAVMVGVLCVALVLGLVGLAVHVLWVAAIIVMALGLGFALANRRRDRIDVVNRRADDADDAEERSDSA
jgi:hypothetical protein